MTSVKEGRAYLLAIIAIVQLSYAQWTTSGSDIYNSNAGNVGIGASNFLQKFTIKSPGTQTGGSSIDYDFGITDGAAFQLQLLGLVNTTGNYGLLQVIKGGIGPGNLALQTQGGNVGIGTTSPGAKLDLGNVNSSSPYVQALTYSGNIQYAQGIGVNLGQSPNAMSMIIGGYSGASAGAASFEVVSANSLTFPYISYTTRFMVSSNGNVGIGTTIPDAKLAVNGTIHTKEVKVDLNVPGPDYVFEPAYKLPKLNELKDYLDKNHHLPEIPSAAQMAKEGLNLGI